MTSTQYVAPHHARDGTAWQIADALRETTDEQAQAWEHSNAQEDAKARAAWQLAQARQEAHAAWQRKQAEKQKHRCTIL